MRVVSRDVIEHSSQIHVISSQRHCDKPRRREGAFRPRCKWLGDGGFLPGGMLGTPTTVSTGSAAGRRIGVGGSSSWRRRSCGPLHHSEKSDCCCHLVVSRGPARTSCSA